MKFPVLVLFIALIGLASAQETASLSLDDCLKMAMEKSYYAFVYRISDENFDLDDRLEILSYFPRVDLNADYLQRIDTYRFHGVGDAQAALPALVNDLDQRGSNRIYPDTVVNYGVARPNVSLSGELNLIRLFNRIDQGMTRKLKKELIKLVFLNELEDAVRRLYFRLALHDLQASRIQANLDMAREIPVTAETRFFSDKLTMELEESLLKNASARELVSAQFNAFLGLPLESSIRTASQIPESIEFTMDGAAFIEKSPMLKNMAIKRNELMFKRKTSFIDYLPIIDISMNDKMKGFVNFGIQSNSRYAQPSSIFYSISYSPPVTNLFQIPLVKGSEIYGYGNEVVDSPWSYGNTLDWKVSLSYSTNNLMRLSTNVKKSNNALKRIDLDIGKAVQDIIANKYSLVRKHAHLEALADTLASRSEIVEAELSRALKADEPLDRSYLMLLQKECSGLWFREESARAEALISLLEYHKIE